MGLLEGGGEVSRGIPGRAGRGDVEVWKETRGADGADVFVGT